VAYQTDRADERDTQKELKAALKSGQFASLYVFCGEEAYLREHYLDLLTQKLTGGPAGDFNFHRFNADTLTPQALAEAVEAMPMMAERTLIRVDDVDFFKQNEHAREQYGEIFSDLPDYCCVVLVYDTIEYKPNGQMKKLAAVMKDKAVVVSFAKQSEHDLATWISRHFRSYGKGISDELCRYLIFITDGMMTSLGPEIQKVAFYASGKDVTRSDIDAVVIPVLNAQTFDISNAIAGGNYELALRKMEDLFSMQEDPMMILGAIGSQLRRLHYARMITSSGKGQETLMQLTGLKSYPAGLTMTAARKVTDEFCRKAVELCLETDRKMKSSTDDPERLLELLIAELAREARRG
jgi:DNA polymerase-3 subunit delta